MKFNDIVDQAEPATTPKEVRQLLDAILDADDMPPQERSAFCAGWVTGVTQALAIVEGVTPDFLDLATGLLNLAREREARLAEWSRKGWLADE